MMRGGEEDERKKKDWLLGFRVPAGSLRPLEVGRKNKTILHRCPRGFSVPNRFSKNKRPLPSDSLRSFWFTSPLADTSLNVIGQLKVMKCYESIMKLCPSRVVPLLFSDWEININVHGKVLAAGTQFFFSPTACTLFDSVFCPLCYCLLALYGAIKHVFDYSQMNSLGFK